MFDRIAPVYDAMNRVMTAGLDRRWRRITVEQVVRPGDRVLDACCGTGDLAIAGMRARRGRGRARLLRRRCSSARGARRPQIEWVQGDVLALPFDDGSFDAATVGFGVRNVDDLEPALRELRRVLRAGRPARRSSRSRRRAARSRRSIASGSTASCRCSARLLPGGSAYTYLPASVRRFPGAGRARRAARASGFAARPVPTFAGGIVALHVGDRRHREHASPADPRGRGPRGVPRRARGAPRALGREPSRARRRGRERGARRRRQAAAAAARLPLDAAGPRAVARRGRRGRARAHGDARPRRPDRPARTSAAARRPRGRCTAPTPRARPATTSSRARSPSSRRPATSRRCRSSPTRRLALARGEALQRTQTHDPSTTRRRRTSSAAR